MSDLMQFDLDNGIGVLRFTRPERRNPYSIAFVDELVATLDAAQADDAVRAVVMTGGAHFSSGGDLVGFQTEMAKGARATYNLVEKVHAGGRAAYGFNKPLIAAVNGVAYGAGMSLALCADVIVAAEDARFCEVFAKVGGCPDTGSSWLLQQRIGAGAARLLILTGREISGKTAHQMRVVEDCVPADQTEATAIALAAEMAANPMFGIESCKRVMRQSAECTFEEALDVECRAQTVLLCAHDFPEAMKAFSEKRKPKFRDC
ncbi:enoyl-CoA hydratase/isomerase family protein [Profundibacter sp.]